MKKRAPQKLRHSSEFKGVVKKMTGKLTSNRELEEEGRDEMLGVRTGRKRKANPPAKRSNAQLNPDPYRRS